MNMDNISERVADLQFTVTQMRVKFKDSIINRENQNKDIEIDILKRTKIIPLHKIQEISLPDIKINQSLTEIPEIDLDTKELKNRMKELRRSVKSVARENQCNILKRMQNQCL